jgi:hypothetical protein
MSRYILAFVSICALILAAPTLRLERLVGAAP